jgi:DNA (cytosine-5)-methyltransferase 1
MPTVPSHPARSRVPDHPQPLAGLRALDLFSGAGGLSCAFEWAGGEVVGAIEYDANAAETFKVNHADARVWVDDIRSVSTQEVARAVGPVDMVIGGPMCQGVSQRGPRDPADERNFAFWKFAEYVRALKPEMFLMENVPALASDVHNRGLAIAVFDELASLGYHLSAEVMNAAWFGAPQLRYRLVVLGSRQHVPAFPECVERGVAGEFTEADFTTVGDAIMDLPPVDAGGGVPIAPLPPLPVAPSAFLREVREGATSLFNHVSADTDKVNLDRIVHVPEGGNWHDIPLDLLPSRFGHVRPSDHTTTYRRLDRSHPAHTITTECGNVTSGSFTHPTQDRAITVREAARLQSFPDWFRFAGPKNSQYRQVGNAVPVLLARRVFERLVDTDEGFRGRLSADLLREYPRARLPITLAPRYKPLFGNSTGARRRRNGRATQLGLPVG